MKGPYVGKNGLYAWPSILGFSVIIGIIAWSYINNLLFILYSSIGLLSICVVVLRLYVYKKNGVDGGWNLISLMVYLYFFVFLIVGITISYLLYENF